MDTSEEQIKQYELERSEKVAQRVEEMAARLRAHYDGLLEKMEGEMRLIHNNFLLHKLQSQRQYEEEYASLVQEMMAMGEEAQEDQLEGQSGDGQRTTATTNETAAHPAVAAAASSNSKSKELQEKQKLLERQRELRQQQQTEYRQVVTRSKEAIGRILADIEARLQVEEQKLQQQHQQPKPLLQQLPDASAVEQLAHCRTFLLGAISELAVMLLTTASSSQPASGGGTQPQPELTIEHLKLAAEKQQQAIERQQQQEKPNNPAHPLRHKLLDPPPLPQLHLPLSNLNNPHPKPPKTSQTPTPSSAPKEFSQPAELLYERSQLELVRFEEVVDRFIAAEENKKRRTGLQLSIRTRINTMCNEAVGKLAEKTRKLLDLLSGKRVEMTASKGDLVQCSAADGSLHFAINTAVMAFLNVAIKQKHMALRLAPVVSVLWARVDPIFGRVFLAHLYRICPYALPYYPVQEEGQSAEEFMVRCGYQLNAQSGAISETDEAFQERVYSLVQLYAAVLQCNVTEANGGGGGGGGGGNSAHLAHPRDLQYAWHWLARVLNEPPQPVMTALMLDAFLTVTAHKLLAAYGRQFEKMLRAIRRSTVPAMETVTPKGDQQTLMKFKSLLEGFERKVARRGGGNRHHQQIARSLLPEDMELVPDGFFRI
ncbi:Nuclear pore complex nucleoporin component [Tyrophagus putrescentiae]|nr:Nuclear pore complex nucleoporin component [Tyrophagus putrescentiae]